MNDQSDGSTGQSDESTSVNELRELVREFVDERDWQKFHNPKNLSMSLAIEAAELMEHFQWLTADESTKLAARESDKRRAAEELADCLAYVLAMANTMQIDLTQTLRAKMIRNAEKYPRPAAE